MVRQGRSAAWLLLALAVAGVEACRGPRAGTVPAGCAPPAGQLAADARADGMVGTYRLTVVARTGPRADSSVVGTLTLMRADTLYYGAAEIDLAAVGAVESGALTPTAPEAPGVRVFAVPGNIMLRLGADANRMDQIRIEGSYTVLRVRALDETGGFRGEWASGAPQEVATGWFCAEPAGR